MLRCVHGFVFLLGALWVNVPLASADVMPALSPNTYDKLHAAQSLIEEGDTGRAVKALQALLAGLPDRSYERAVVQQALGHAYLRGEDYANAVHHVRQALAAAVLPANAQQRLSYTLAQLHFATAQYAEAAQILTLLLKNAVEFNAGAYVMLGSAYLRLERYQAAVAPLETAIERTEHAPENWYNNLLAAYYELKDYDRCVTLLHAMLRRFPRREIYWRQLADIALARGRPDNALAVMELAYANAQLPREEGILHLARLFAAQGAPYKAGVLLENAFSRGHIVATDQHRTLLADVWLQARETEKAIAALRSVGERVQSAQLGMRLARLYLDHQRWQAAAETLQAWLESGRLTDDEQGRAWLLLGIARYEAGALDEARRAFVRAQQHAASRPDARQWLNFVAEKRVPAQAGVLAQTD